MRRRIRAAFPRAVLALLVGLSGFAAWLGVDQSPAPPPGQTTWQRFVADTEAAGTLAFSSVSVLTGQTASTSRTSGVVDFPSAEAIELTAIGSAGFPSQWIETAVVNGQAYQRLGRDGTRGRHLPRFSGPWLRQVDPVAVTPLRQVSGPRLPDEEFPVHLVAMGTRRVGGVVTTEYRVISVLISCPGAPPGRPALESTITHAWVDDQGRIRRFSEADADIIASPNGPQATSDSIVTTFGHFGTAVTVTTPAQVLGAPATRPLPPQPDPLAGCLVTPR
ncbi:MAG: hypothetical protein ACRDV6_04475 [Acidimicrobiales bacterium]